MKKIGGHRLEGIVEHTEYPELAQFLGPVQSLIIDPLKAAKKAIK